jgi:hypothetical protein
MQEMLEWVRATLPMDLDWPIMIEQKVLFLQKKEKDVIIESFHEGMRCHMFDPSTGIAEEYYNETFNTNQKNLPDSTNGYTYYPQERKIIFNTK